jgi:nucleoside-diphosphate-sugar epimerase
MNNLAVALLGTKGFIGNHIAQSCSEAKIPIFELQRWDGNRENFTNQIQEIKNANPGKQIVLIQTAWYSTNNSNYRVSRENYEWVSTTKAILEICKDHEILFAGLGTCLEKLAMGEEAYTQSKTEIRSHLELEFPTKEWIWFQLHYVYSLRYLKPAVLKKANESAHFLTLETPNDKHDFIEVRDAADAMIHSLITGLRGIVEIGTGKTVEVSALLKSLFPKLEIAKGNSQEKRISFQGAAEINQLVNSGWVPKFSIH